MREKRVSLVVLTCSVLVATCASVSYSFVTSSYFHKYVAVIPILFSGQITSVSPATVWIPEEEALDIDGSVRDEFAEVAHIFARPDNRIIRPKDEDEITQQPVPWTSLKNEWKIYEKIHDSKRKTPEEKRKKNKASAEDNDSSEEDEDDNDEEEDEEEEDDAKRRSAMTSIFAQKSPSVSVPVVSERKSGGSSKNGDGRKEIPLAFFGQQNHDDDERDYLKDEATIFKKKKQQKKDKDAEEDDTSASNEAASVEDYADYAQDENDDDDNDNDYSSEKKNGKKKLQFEDIPLAIREMILNDLANQNNGSGYHPNLTPQVTGGSSELNNRPYIGQQHQQGGSTGGSSASVENDNDDESNENSSEEEEEDDNNAAERVQPLPNLGSIEPTPPAIRPSSIPKKGDDDEDEPYGEDEGGKGKGKGKGKRKKGKKGNGWAGQMHYSSHKPHGWHDYHKEPDFKWNPEKHNGVLEQLVRGSTWERVLKYYHWKRDQQRHEENQHYDEHSPHNVHKNTHPPHHEEHPGHELSHGLPEGVEGWGWDQQDSSVKKVLRKAFKGSFWERAVHTYAKYKENQAKNPRKPALIDLDSEHGVTLGIGHR